MIVALRKLSREEASRVFPRHGQIDVSEYAAALQALQVGDSAELERVDDRLYFQVLPAIVRSAGRPENGQRGRPRATQPEAPIPVAATQPAAPAAPTTSRARRRPANRRQVNSPRLPTCPKIIGVGHIDTELLRVVRTTGCPDHVTKTAKTTPSWTRLVPDLNLQQATSMPSPR